LFNHCETGFNGELGHEDFNSSSEPKHLCIGYQACVVRARASV
jgi:hypothetical protein